MLCVFAAVGRVFYLTALYAVYAGFFAVLLTIAIYARNDRYLREHPGVGSGLHSRASGPSRHSSHTMMLMPTPEASMLTVLLRSNSASKACALPVCLCGTPYCPQYPHPMPALPLNAALNSKLGGQPAPLNPTPWMWLQQQGRL